MSAEEHQEMSRHMTRGIRHRGWVISFEASGDGVSCLIKLPRSRAHQGQSAYVGHGATVLSAYEAAQSEMLEAGE